MGLFKRHADDGSGNSGNSGGNGSVNPETDGVTDEWKLGDPDRRKTSPRKRADYARKHGLSTSSPDNGDGKPWKYYVPKSVVWMLASLFLAVGGFFAKEFFNVQLQWKSKIDSHLEQATAGFSRLDANEREIRSVRKDVSRLTNEFRQYRIDQIEEKVWNARRHSDLEAERYFVGQLRRLKAEEKDEN